MAVFAQGLDPANLDAVASFELLVNEDGPGMLVESHDDLVTFSPVETLREDRHPLCGIAGERQFIARDTHELRCLVPHQLAIVEPIAIRGIFR